MTPNLDELERLAKEATPGPWYWNPYRASLGQQDPTKPTDFGSQLVLVAAEVPFHETTNGDMAYIAALDPLTVFALIARCREAEKDRGRLNELEQLRNDCEGRQLTLIFLPTPESLRERIDAAISAKGAA